MNKTMNKNLSKTICKIELGYFGQILATPAIAAKLIELLAQTTIVENEWTGEDNVLQIKRNAVHVTVGEFEALDPEQVQSMREAVQAEKAAEKAAEEEAERIANLPRAEIPADFAQAIVEQ